VTERLHIACGTVYLIGWVNVDVPSPRCYLADDAPTLVEKYRTCCAEHYYSRHSDHNTLDGFRAGTRDDPYVADRFGTWSCIPCRDGNASELLSRSSFEHLSIREAHSALDEAYRVLEPGGLLRLSVPDHDATLEQLRVTQDKVLIRHFTGPRASPYGYHSMSYTRAGLIELVESHGFTFLGDEDFVHTSPALCLRWGKGALP
jgi:hypothetical protein